MAHINTRALPGMMELLPGEQLEFDRMRRIIEEEYRRFGFTQLDTPALERTETLLAKVGGETAKQMYRFTKGDNELALRFDLTVPLARYVAEHMNDLSFPFRRAHIAKVYRGERPQAGRFREFYQCDIDVIGRDELSLSYDAEAPSVIYQIFKRLDFGKFTIRVNNRKILGGLMAHLGVQQIAPDILRVVDKIEKISRDDLTRELLGLGLTAEQVGTLMEFVAISGQPDQAIPALRNLGVRGELFVSGVDELEQVTRLMSVMGVDPKYFTVDLAIARGLDYYTGTVYETVLDEHPGLGSICSGGRYDDLASYYTSTKLPGVGISIGLTRLFSQLQGLGIVKAARKTVADVLVMPLGDEQLGAAADVSQLLRNAGINVDTLLADMSIKKRFAYADRLGVPYAIVVGAQEVAEGNSTVQNMASGDKVQVNRKDIAEFMAQRLALLTPQC
jgi:histidyl-tRNA synthetase